MADKTFSPPLAAFTKAQIAEDINGIFDAGLDPSDITDEEAQAYAELNYKWLCDSIGLDQDSALDAEEEWQAKWFVRHRVNAKASQENDARIMLDLERIRREWGGIVHAVRASVGLDQREYEEVKGSAYGI